MPNENNALGKGAHRGAFSLKETPLERSYSSVDNPPPIPLTPQTPDLSPSQLCLPVSSTDAWKK